MNIEELTLGQIKQLQSLLRCETSSPGRWQIGSNYFIRTVTHHLLGRLEEVTEHELWLSSVSWIADDGRFHEFLATGKSQQLEVEPAPDGDVPIGRGSLIDAYLWRHSLLREVK